MLTLLLLATLQTPTIEVLKPSTPFFVEWYQPDAVNSQPQFRWVCNGTVIKNFSTSEPIAQGEPDATGGITYRVQVPGLPVGQHQCHINAFNFVGEVSGADQATPVGTVPSVPGKFTIIQITVVNGGGGH